MDLRYGYYDNGQIATRTDTVSNRVENYTYDPMNRLTNWALTTGTGTGNTATNTTYAYNTDGNLLSTTVTPAIGTATTTTDNYSPTNNTNTQGGPHAVDTQTITTGTTISTTGYYTYDSHGRQTGGAGRNLTYNACDLPTKITTTTGIWNLTYGPFCERATKTGPDGTTIYVASLYQKRVTTGKTSNVFLIPGVGQIQVDNNGAIKTQYQITDTQGSTSLVVDGSTGLLAGPTRFYDPFGGQINADGTPKTNTPDSPVTNGYTGQEQDTEFGLDNYGGRLYDPTLKRFITTDPVIANPLDSQTRNPYSYVYNNPVNLTDPTGYDGEENTSSGDGGGDYQFINEVIPPQTYLGADGSWYYLDPISGQWFDTAPKLMGGQYYAYGVPLDTAPILAGYEPGNNTPASPGDQADAPTTTSSSPGGWVPPTEQGLAIGANVLKGIAAVTGLVACSLSATCGTIAKIATTPLGIAGVIGVGTIKSDTDPDFTGKAIGGLASAYALATTVQELRGRYVT